jgi:histidinol-phosphate aminotransferase
MRDAATDTLRLYPDPEATELREMLAAHHGVKPEQVFVGNGSDEVLAHAFVALLKQPKPLLFPDVTYSFYPVWAQLFGLIWETVPLDGGRRARVEDYRREAGSIVIANPNAPTGVALRRAEIAQLLEDHPNIPVLIDEAYIDFGGESAVPLIPDHLNLLVVQTMSKSRALAGLRRSLFPRELRQGSYRTRSNDPIASCRQCCRAAPHRLAADHVPLGPCSTSL